MTARALGAGQQLSPHASLCRALRRRPLKVEFPDSGAFPVE